MRDHRDVAGFAVSCEFGENAQNPQSALSAECGISRLKLVGVQTARFGKTVDHGGFNRDWHRPAGVLQQRDKIVARLPHLRQLEIQQADPGQTLSLGQPQQVFGMIVAQDHHAGAIGVADQRGGQGCYELRSAIGIAQHGLAIKVDHQSCGLCPGGGALVG